MTMIGNFDWLYRLIVFDTIEGNLLSSRGEFDAGGIQQKF
jgi:hypothetical protein